MSANITIVGRCGADPERVENDYGGVCRVNLATNKTTKGEKTTTWWRVSAWGRTGDMLAKAAKGCRVAVSGEAFVRSYVGRDGNRKQAVEVTAARVDLIDWPDSLTPQHEAPKVSGTGYPDDDVPF